MNRRLDVIFDLFNSINWNGRDVFLSENSGKVYVNTNIFGISFNKIHSIDNELGKEGMQIDFVGTSKNGRLYFVVSSWR